MARVIMATCATEGGNYSPDKSSDAPIRFYSDRWVEDDIFARFMGRVKRERLSKSEYRFVRNRAKLNRLEGLA